MIDRDDFIGCMANVRPELQAVAVDMLRVIGQPMTLREQDFLSKIAYVAGDIHGDRLRAWAGEVLVMLGDEREAEQEQAAELEAW